ncbi:hypothetical protein NO136_20590, partial [Clostridioides difficile]|nr:hypothetical protein [Clostridioides difficile]
RASQGIPDSGQPARLVIIRSHLSCIDNLSQSDRPRSPGPSHNDIGDTMKNLQRHLSARHIRFLALGSAIGTG